MLTGVRVLIVDDRDDDLDLYCYVLSRYDAAVSVAHTVREAFERFARVKPCVLVSDIGLVDDPEGGYALIRAIRALSSEQGGTTPAVALTARAFPSDRDRALEAGFNEHCAKPFTPDELIGVIVRLVDRTSQQAQG
jgi:CheY-like chemotaxis protein